MLLCGDTGYTKHERDWIVLRQLLVGIAAAHHDFLYCWMGVEYHVGDSVHYSFE